MSGINRLRLSTAQGVLVALTGMLFFGGAWQLGSAVLLGLFLGGQFVSELHEIRRTSNCKVPGANVWESGRETYEETRRKLLGAASE